MSAPSQPSGGAVTAVFFTDPGEGGAQRAFDGWIPLRGELSRVVVRVAEKDTSGPKPPSAYADHPLHALHGIDIVEVRGDLANSLGQAQACAAGDEGWLWLLEADSVPGVDTLGQMLAVARRSSRVGIVGPKVVSDEDPRVLMGIGQSVSLRGRALDDLNRLGWDQGQYDDRSDVVGVPLVGMLIRADVLADVGGIESSFDEAVAGLDLSWRAHLMGHRVLVAPKAVIRRGMHTDGSAGHAHLGATPVRVARQRAWVALARGAFTRVPGRAVAMLMTSLVAMVVMGVTRRPRAFALAWAEASAVLFPWPSLRARWRFRGKATVDERDLAELFLPRAATRVGLRWAPAVADPLAPDPHRGAGPRDPRSFEAIETGPVSDDALSIDSGEPGRHRVWSWPLAVALALSVLAASLRWRDLSLGLALSGWGVTSPDLLPVGTDTAGVLAAWWQGWTGEGLGQAGQGPLWLLPFSGFAAAFEHLLGGPDGAHVAGVTTAWMLFLAMPASVLTAYRAARSLVASRPVRAILALAWAGAAPVAVAVDGGRLGPVVVHVMAPLLVAGVVASVRRGRRGTSAAFGVAVLCGFAIWWVPLVGAFAVVAGIVVTVAARGWARLRGLVIAGLPVALMGPAAVTLVAEPVRLLGGAGATAAGATPLVGWQALLLHPGGPASLSMWWIAPAWVLALAGVLGLRGGRSTTRALWLSVAGLVGVGAAVALSRVTVGYLPPGYVDAGVAISIWPGTVLSLGGACVLLAAGIGATDLLPRPGAGRGQASRAWGNAIGVTMLAVAAAGVVGTLAVSAAAGVGSQVAVARGPLPAVVAEQGAGPDRVRIITLVPDVAEPDETDVFGVEYDLSGTSPPPWLRDRTRDLKGNNVGGTEVEEAVTALLDTSDAAVLDPVPLERALADLAVAYIAVEAAQGHPLVAQLDQSPNLTRVSSARDTALWRVDGQTTASRVWTQGPQGQRQGVDVSGSGAGTRGMVPAEAAAVAVSQSQEWAEHATVRLNGDELSAEPGFPLRYAVPPGGGELIIEVPPPSPWWWWATAALLAVALLLAIPFVGSRPRRMT